MAKLKKLELKKFGGTEKIGETQLNGFNHDVSTIEEQSQTSLEQDLGTGQVAVIRCFEFKANMDAFKEHPIGKQELFNYHFKGIEIALWKDGLQIMPDVEPRVVFDDDKGQYRIFVGSLPMKGQIVQQTPKTLTQLVHGRLSD